MVTTSGLIAATASATGGSGGGGGPLPPVRAVLGDFALTDIQAASWIPAGDSIRQGYLYCAQSTEDRKRWVADWVAVGIDHMWIAPTVNYGGGSAREADKHRFDRFGKKYDARGRSGRWAVRVGARSARPYATAVDCRKDPDRFCACVTELRAAGIVPYVQIAQPETYGTRDQLNMDQLSRDLSQWKAWGWTALIDGLGTNLWPESDADTYPWQLVEICRLTRSTLPKSYLMAHVGRNGEGTYQGHGDDPTAPSYWGPERFWSEMHSAGCTGLGWEAKTEIFEQDDWERILVREYLGAYTRIVEPLSRAECQQRAQSVGVTLTDHDLDNMRTEGEAYDGGGTELPYWEGPEYGIQWASWKKADAARLLVGVGATGSMSGAITIPSQPGGARFAARA